MADEAGEHALRRDLTQITLNVMFVSGLIAASFWVMQPFLPAILWAMTLVIATWPLMIWIQRHTGNRRIIGVLAMTLTLLLVLIVPFWLAVSTILSNLDGITQLVHNALTMEIPLPPDWVAKIPLFGSKLADAWTRLATSGINVIAPKLLPYAGASVQWFASAAGSLGGMFLQFVLTTAIAAVMYSGGETGAAAAIRFGRRLGGERGEMAVRLAGKAIRGVALGVMVTAVAQSALGGIGLAVAGMPFAPLLTALMFVLCLIQIGPGLVLFPAVIWLYYTGDSLWATVLLLFTVVAVTLDGFLRPVLIRKGADLPLLLILAGVIGGLIAFGVLGIFLGPVILATAYTLLNAWMEEGPQPEFSQEPAGETMDATPLPSRRL
ncbi:putative PurR-regulated permease PerM [Pararhizobium capsulatum DSM 1112]|uniref:PurR-regulated permease PerM n=1 Tax=Pararhizobium capsulatum DSM 1112 TaxID=1121113 RepID=A0ABU0BVH6_9HYPH|nr:AI-2E family transporter YdiK [Pararhizobium capsulatum]MDQ0322256.1 putative PurR-regulated permease PerM [Pararhizobium capsulatum DSM 1112]